MIRNFLYNVCGCEGNWSMGTFIEDTIRDIRKQVGDSKVLCALVRRRRFFGRSDPAA